MDEQMCPRCKTTKYRNPSLKLFVNTCGHPLCENCVELLFVRGSGTCPQCNVPLRRNNFREQLFEDPFIEKETEIRKRILKDFNKKEEDFPSLEAYNDYLEEIEAIVFNLVKGIDLERTKLVIDKYKKANQDLIKRNRKRLSKEEAFLSDLIEKEKTEHAAYEKASKTEHQQEEVAIKRRKEALIDELMFSDLPAGHILAQHKQELDKTNQQQQSKSKTAMFSTGITIGLHSHHLPIPKAEDVGEVFVFKATVLDWIGPTPPPAHHLLKSGYLNNIRRAVPRELAGGFTPTIACSRALQDAFCGLLFRPMKDLFSTGQMDVA